MRLFLKKDVYMDIDQIRELIDRFYGQGDSKKAEEVLLSGASNALEEGDDYLLLQILNELIGHYRETSEWENAFEIADRAEAVASRVFPEQSIPYATTLLNIASMYRAAGRLENARALYRKVELIYAVTLEPNDMLYASLYNNEALLYQEERKFAEAKALLVKALDIVHANGREYEEAVSLANIAATMIQLNETDEAIKCAEASVTLFEHLGVRDQHLCAALSAMGSYYYINKKYDNAASCFKQGMEIMELVLGKNEYYERLKDNYDASMEAARSTGGSDITHQVGEPLDKTKGLEISKKYYENYVRPMIDEKFPEYVSKIAAGLAGEGSDAFGYDDELSRDHDWGPSVVLWITEETNEKIGQELRDALEELPDEIDGIKRAPFVQGRERRGVQVIPEFFKRLTGVASYEEIDWRNADITHLAAAVNGEIWRDDEGIITDFRNRIKEGLPEDILYLHLAEGCAKFSREGQYNAARVLKRNDAVTSKMFIYDAAREAMKLFYLMNGKYYPHDKWLRRGLRDIEGGDKLDILINAMTEDHAKTEDVGAFLAMELYRRDFISDIDPYLDHQTDELLKKSAWCKESTEDLAMLIAKDEFAAFDKVSNEGGRASCQDDWPTFNIMRRSQYLTWNKTMLLQYLYDFEREMSLGHNLITEKYGRMMESTAPERYEEIKDNFPPLSDEKKSIIDRIAGIQVAWMEEFADKFPTMAGRARTIHTYDDTPYDTSYETYLRGEISTYSDKMLELYARFIVSLSNEGKNLAYETMLNSARLYGFESLEKAEGFFSK